MFAYASSLWELIDIRWLHSIRTSPAELTTPTPNFSQVGCRLVGALLRDRNITLMQVFMAGNEMEEHVLQVCVLFLIWACGGGI